MPKDVKAEALSPMQELHVLFPPGVRVVVKLPVDSVAADVPRPTSALRVRPLTAREIVTAIADVLTIVDAIGEGMAYAAIAKEHFDEACGLVALATGKDGEFIANLDGGDFVRVWKAFMGENTDFFVEAVDLASRVKKAATVLGGPTASSSLPPAE